MLQTDLKSLLQSVDIQATKQRLDIASVLLLKPQHMSAEQVIEAVDENISRATVYNTLNLFVEKGLVKELNIDPNRIFYDSNTDAHCHFFNEDTGVLTDIAQIDIDINALPDLPENTVIKGLDLIVRLKQQA